MEVHISIMLYEQLKYPFSLEPDFISMLHISEELILLWGEATAWHFQNSVAKKAEYKMFLNFLNYLYI